MSSATRNFFLLFPKPLLFNVEVPPFLVSWAIAFSYMYCCIGKLSVRSQLRVPQRAGGETVLQSIWTDPQQQVTCGRTARKLWTEKELALRIKCPSRYINPSSPPPPSSL